MRPGAAARAAAVAALAAGSCGPPSFGTFTISQGFALSAPGDRCEAMRAQVAADGVWRRPS